MTRTYFIKGRLFPCLLIQVCTGFSRVDVMFRKCGTLCSRVHLPASGRSTHAAKANEVVIARQLYLAGILNRLNVCLSKGRHICGILLSVLRNQGFTSDLSMYMPSTCQNYVCSQALVVPNAPMARDRAVRSVDKPAILQGGFFSLEYTVPWPIETVLPNTRSHHMYLNPPECHPAHSGLGTSSLVIHRSHITMRLHQAE